MNRIITLCMVLLLQMAAYAQGINSDYNPQNPPGPHEDGYGDSWPTLTLTTSPDYSGGINITVDEDSCVNNRVQAGAMVRLNAFARVIGFRFKAWTSNGDTLSTTTPYIFKMPNKDVSICAVFEFDPENPETPHGNKWDLESGELIMTDFRPGDLYHRIAEVTYRDPWSSYWDRIKNATVAGVCAEDFENYSWTTYSDWEAFTFGNAENIEFLDYSRTSGLTKVPAYCFGSYNTYPLKTIVMPASTASIGKEAFRSLKELTDITCFATTPPTFDGLVSGEEGYEEDWGNERWAFDGLTLDNIVVHVPAESVPLYQEARGWNKFMILPITQGVYRLTVSLPQAQNYKNMFLELANNQTGQSLRYVITDATTYTFNNLIRDTHHTLYVKNQRGVVMGTVEGIEIIDKDVQVSVANLKAPHDITLRLTVPDGSAVGDDAYTVTWTDRLANYLGAGATLAGQTEGLQVRCRVKLGETLGRQYLAPEDTVYTVTQNGVLAIALKAIPTKAFGGTVIAENGGQPLRGATVTVSQTLNGQYNATQTVRTDADGRWTLTAFEVPTTITAQATDYIPLSLTVPDGSAVDSAPADTIALRDLTGTVVNLDLYYYPTVAEDAEPLSEDYADYDNVGYTVYDETHGREVTEMALQYPKLVLIDQQLDEGTLLRITANSLTNQFAPVTTTCKVDSANQTIATIGITERGRLHAKFSMTDNQKVMGMLYDAEGGLVGWSPYNNTELTVNNLVDGQYTLVTMGYNTLFTSVSSLTALVETGISDALMVKNTVTVHSGRITEISNTTIPTFKEDDFRLTGEGTSFTVNKTEVTVGQYVTFKAQVDFKASVATAAGVQLLFDLPEGCEYVQQSMMMGNRTVSPQQEGRRLTLSLEDPTQVVRFCVIPTQSGVIDPVAYVSFVNNGQRTTQPIGSATVTAESLTITVPEVTGRRLLPVTGMAAPQSTVQVYDGDVLVAETTALGTGYWSAMAELHEPYNLSSHMIHAIVTSSEGIKMQSETKTVTVNRSSLTPVVTMHLKGISSEHHNKDFVFDFRTGEVNPKGMKLTDFGEFSLDFNIDFYDQNDMMVNDTTAIRNVKLYVKMEHGEIHTFPLNYSLRYKDWYLATDFNGANMPVNVDLDYSLIAENASDREQMDAILAEVDNYLAESRRQYLDVIHTFDDDVVPANQAQQDELDTLMKIEEPDEATEQRIEQLMRSLYGDSIVDASKAEFAVDFSEVDAILDNPDVSAEQLDAVRVLLDGIMDKLTAEHPDYSEGNETDIAELDRLIADLVNEGQSLRETTLMIMSLLWYPDTGLVKMPQGDMEEVLQIDDRNVLFVQRHLTTIDREQLLSEGYTEMPMTDGSTIFCLQDSCRTSFVDTKRMMFYSMTTLDEAEAAARNVRRREGTEVEVKPTSVILTFFPQHCIDKWSKLLDDISTLYETIRYAQGASAIEYIAKGANVILSGGESLRCLYENAIKKAEEFIKTTMDAAFAKVQGKLDAAKLEKANLEKRINYNYAGIKATREANKRYMKSVELYEKKILEAKTVAERRLLEKQRDLFKTSISKNEGIISKAYEQIGRWKSKIDINGPLTKNIQKLEQGLAKVLEKKNTILDQFKRFLPVKLKETKTVNFKVAGILNSGPMKTLFKFGPLLSTIVTCAEDILKWVSQYGACEAKLPCEGNPTGVMELIGKCRGFAITHTLTNAGKIIGEGGSLALSAAPVLSAAWIAGKLLEVVNIFYSSWQNKASERDHGIIEQLLASLKCDKDDDDDDNSKSGTLDSKSPDNGKPGNKSVTVYVKFPFITLKFVRDPSGYVYEAVSSNRIEGVRASCYYKEEKEDMYGDLYDDVVFWDAENYEQENPLFTDADGRYAWDVPTGWWQVKYEKDGYETTYSDWLPVPPPQLEVNVGITQLRQPMVSRVGAYENAIEVEFDKYMNPETLNKTNISVTKDGKTLSGTVQLLNAEAGYQKPDVKYASRVAFMPTERLLFNEKVILTIRRQVESYAGLEMESDYQQEFTVVNDTLTVERDTTSVDSTAMRVATPTASRISGTTVAPGATVSLSCATDGAIIWYTTDGTCPCDENGTRKRYTAPIVISDHLVLKAYAVKGVMQESEVASFEFFVESHSVITSAAGWCTFFDSQSNYRLPAGLKAYCITTDNSQSGGIAYTELPDGVIPKGVAVAIKSERQQQATYTLSVVDEAPAYNGENLLYGSDVTTTTAAPGNCYFYKACYGPTGTPMAGWFGWYPANSAKGPFTSAAHRAWLAIPKDSQTRGYYTFDGAAGIGNSPSEDSDNIWYDLQGRRMDRPRQPGIYLKNRRKEIVK